MKWLIVLCICSLWQQPGFGDTDLRVPNVPIDIGQLEQNISDFATNFDGLKKEISLIQFQPATGVVQLSVFVKKAGDLASAQILDTFQNLSQQLVADHLISDKDKYDLAQKYTDSVVNALYEIGNLVEANIRRIHSVTAKSLSTRDLANTVRTIVQVAAVQQITAALTLISLPNAADRQINDKYAAVETLEIRLRNKLDN